MITGAPLDLSMSKSLSGKTVVQCLATLLSFSENKLSFISFLTLLLNFLVAYSKTREFKKTQKVVFYRCIKAATMIELSALYLV